MGRGKARIQRYIDSLEDYSVPIPWDDFVYIMTRRFLFEKYKKKGGRGIALSLGDATITVYEPHGGNLNERFVSKSDRNKAIQALISLELI